MIEKITASISIISAHQQCPTKITISELLFNTGHCDKTFPIMFGFSFVIKENVIFCFQSQSNNLISEFRDCIFKPSYFSVNYWQADVWKIRKSLSTKRISKGPLKVTLNWVELIVSLWYWNCSQLSPKRHL